MRIGLTFDYRNKAVKQAKTDIFALGKSALKATVGITSASIAISKLNRLLVTSTQAALADQKAQANLTKTLQNSGFGMAADQANEYINSLQMATGVSEDQLRPAFLQLFNAIGSVTDAQRILNIAMDTSAATGRDLSSVTAAIAKAAAGTKTSIQRLGLGIDKATLQAASFDDIMAILEKKFRGSTAVATETMAGKVAKLRIAAQEAKEEIGLGLLDAFDTLATQGGKDIDDLTTKIVNMGVTVGDTFRGIALAWKDVQKALGIDTEQGTVGLTQTLDLFIPFMSELKQIQEWFASRGAASRISGNISGTGYLGYQAQVRAEKAAAAARAKELARQKQMEQARLARERATEAQKKKAAALDAKTKELASRFDLELISLAAAKRKATDQETMTRLTALQALAQQGYNSEANSINELDELLKKLTLSQNAYTASVLASASAWSQITTGPNAGAFRMAEQAANQGLGATGLPLAGSVEPAGTPTGGTQNVTVNINALSTMDIEEAVAAAVNSGSRAGLAYTQVFSRL